jgi:hypothetical protein
VVSDRDNGRVQLFSQRGQFIRTVGSKGSGEGQLTKPIGVGVTSKVLRHALVESIQVHLVRSIMSLIYQLHRFHFVCPVPVSVPESGLTHRHIRRETNISCRFLFAVFGLGF